MATAIVNDVYMNLPAMVTSTTTHLQVLDTTGASRVAVSVTVSVMNGTSPSLKGFVQGSNDQGNWFDLGTTHDVDLSAPGTDAAQDIKIGGWAFVRMRWVFAAPSGSANVVFDSALNTSL
jgi:hypothetical protein